MKKKIFVDAGHMGVGKGSLLGRQLDCGAVGALPDGSKLYEAEVALKICKKVRDFLKDDFDVKLSREKSQHQSLQKKVSLANNWGADLFISVHNNSFNGKASGDEVLYKSNNGKKVSTLINDKLKEIIPENTNRGLKHRDNLHVLNKTKAVATLVECGFIDSQTQFLSNDENINRYARAIAEGIRRYFGIPAKIKKPIEKPKKLPVKYDLDIDELNEQVAKAKLLVWQLEKVLRDISEKLK